MKVSFKNKTRERSLTGYVHYIYAYLSRRATGARLNFSSGPFLGRPKCELRATRAPFSIKYLMVGILDLIRVSSVIVFPSRGTFKSQRTRTLFPFNSTWIKERDSWQQRQRVAIMMNPCNHQLPWHRFSRRIGISYIVYAFLSRHFQAGSPTIAPHWAKRPFGKGSYWEYPEIIMICKNQGVNTTAPWWKVKKKNQHCETIIQKL